MTAPVDLQVAWQHIQAAIRPLGDEDVPLAAATGRVLRRDVCVDRDLPPFDRAAMDGFAVAAADVATVPVRLQVAGESAPGVPFAPHVPRGAAVRIMTGAPVPGGCDAVVPVEDTSGFEGAAVEIRRGVQAGAHIAPQGSECSAGVVVLTAGVRLRPVDTGVLAMVGNAQVRVGRRPKVAILSTGNELVPHAETPGRYHIRNSNAPMLAALAAPDCEQVSLLGTARDDRADLQRCIALGLQADVLLVTGGVSMGAYDFVAAALELAGVRFAFRHVALQPGKPAAFGVHACGAVLALPGNPVSALTTFRLFARPALRLLAGETDVWPRFTPQAAGFAWERRHAKWLLLPGRRAAGRVERVEYTGSGDLTAYAHADCQIVLPPGRTQVVPGDAVDTWDLE